MKSTFQGSPSKPGKDGGTFFIKFQSVDWVRKGDILSADLQGTKVEVLKVYKLTRWRKFLLKLGFKKVKFLQVKVINYDPSKGNRSKRKSKR